MTDVLAVHRITRFVTADVLTQRWRDELVGRAYLHRSDEWRPGDQPPLTGWADYAEADPDAPKLATLLTCRWCASVWVAAGVVAARRWLPGWRWLASALAASSASVLLAHEED